MIISPFGTGPRFDDDARAEIKKAVVIAALSAVATKAIEVVGDEVKAWLAARREAAKKSESK